MRILIAQLWEDFKEKIECLRGNSVKKECVMTSLRPYYLWLCSPSDIPQITSPSVSALSVVLLRDHSLSRPLNTNWNTCFRCCFPGTALVIFPLVAFICSTNLDLRFSHTLCDKEKQFREARREKVMLGIKKLLRTEDPCHPEEVWIKVLLTHILHANFAKSKTVSVLNCGITWCLVLIICVQKNLLEWSEAVI